MPTSDFDLPNNNSQFKTLGGLWIIYGVIRLVMALFLFMYEATATLMFGALLDRVGNPFALMGIFHFLYAVGIVFSIVCGLLAIVAGVTLLGGRRSARKVALVAAVFSVSDIPLGTTLGIYTLVELLPVHDAPVYSQSRQAA